MNYLIKITQIFYPYYFLVTHTWEVESLQLQAVGKLSTKANIDLKLREAFLKQTAAVIISSIATCSLDIINAHAKESSFSEGNCQECLGVMNDLLAPCPDSTTCVSTQDDKPYCFMEPWSYEVSTERAKLMISNYLSTLAGLTVVAESDRYIRAQVLSLNGLIIDDVEIYLTPSDYTVQFRANRRNALTDLGQNRKRMEKMRIDLAFEKLPVLRNRTRAFIFGESPFDWFGPSGYNNEVPENMNQNSIYADLDPLAPPFETPSPRLDQLVKQWWSQEANDRVYEK